MLLTILLCAGLIGLDQGLKYWAVQSLQPVGVLPGISPIFQFSYVENDGAAFSMLSGRQGILIAITGLALLVVAYILVFRRPQDKLEYTAFVLIFSGGVGNLIDRVGQGFVVDYLDLTFMDFAVFNFADICVVVGFALLIIATIRLEVKHRRARKAGEDGGETPPPESGPAEEDSDEQAG